MPLRAWESLPCLAGGGRWHTIPRGHVAHCSDLTGAVPIILGFMRTRPAALSQAMPGRPREARQHLPRGIRDCGRSLFSCVSHWQAGGQSSVPRASAHQGWSDAGSGLPLKPPPRAPRAEPNPHLLPTQPSLDPGRPRPSHWGPSGLPRAPVATLWRLKGSPCPVRRASSRSCRPPRLWPCSRAPVCFSHPVFACAEPSSGRSVHGVG